MAFCTCGRCGEGPSGLLVPLELPDVPEDDNPAAARDALRKQLQELKSNPDSRFQLVHFRASRWRLEQDGSNHRLTIGMPSPKRPPRLVRRSFGGGHPDGDDPFSADGPWDLRFYLRIPSEADWGSTTRERARRPHAGEEILVDLRVNSDFPESPASVRVAGNLHNIFVQGEGGAMPLLFYQRFLVPDEQQEPLGEKSAASNAPTFSLRRTLDGLVKFFQTDLGALNLDKMFGSEAAKQLPAPTQYGQMHMKFRENIDTYAPLSRHPEFFALRAGDAFPEEWLDDRFKAWRSAGCPDNFVFCPDDFVFRKPDGGQGERVLTEYTPKIFSFPLFTTEFGDMLVDEIRGILASGIEVQRPNSMNRYGVILNSVGLYGMMTVLQQAIFATGFCERKYGAIGGAWDDHHSFIVQYEPGKDKGLDMHTDDSDVTLNFCLGGEFTGSQVAFCGMMGASNHRKEELIYEQRKGHCLVHLGRQRHGAIDIEKGERMNLIMWNRSRLYRGSAEPTEHRTSYQQEAGKPDKVCLSYTHDKDYGVFKNYPRGFESFKGRGWCPPRGAEYEGYQGEVG